jgi:thiol:disulfide interchange protein DsbC
VPVNGKIRAILKERIPTLAILDIYETAIPGIYELVSPDGIRYTDASADHLIMGQLLETQTHRNLTAEHWNALTSIDFESLPFALAIKATRGSGAREIAVFADPKCPYCQALEAQVARLDDLTVYTFLYPLEDVHPGATVRAHQIWCAHDRTAAWVSWMRNHETAPAEECSDDPIKELAALGEKLHIQSTPTIFFRSGRRSSGLPTAERFEHLLDTESVTTPIASADQGARPVR